jgi:hypothetical protein
VNQVTGEAAWQQRIPENPQSLDPKHEPGVGARSRIGHGGATSPGRAEKCDLKNMEKRGETTENHVDFFLR